MSDREPEVLLAEIQETIAVLERVASYLIDFVDLRLPSLGKSTDTAFTVAGALENYYTAAETLFVRISQHFENHLSPQRWHTDLLHKMTIEIRGIRPRLLSERTPLLMDELLRFRHFRRYYFSLDFDWRRLDLLVEMCREAHILLKDDLETFAAALVD